MAPPDPSPTTTGSICPRARAAETLAVGRPVWNAGGVEALSVDVVVARSIVAPGDPHAARAVGGHRGAALFAGRGAHGDAVRGPQEFAGRVDVLRVEVVVAAAHVLPHDEDAARAVGRDHGKILITDSGADREIGLGRARPIRKGQARHEADQHSRQDEARSAHRDHLDSRDHRSARAKLVLRAERRSHDADVPAIEPAGFRRFDTACYPALRTGSRKMPTAGGRESPAITSIRWMPRPSRAPPSTRSPI